MIGNLVRDHEVGAKDARLFIERSIAEAHGWEVLATDREEAAGESAYVYAFDIQSGLSWVAVLGFDQFHDQLTKFREAPFAWSEVSQRINQIMVDLVTESADTNTPPVFSSSAHDHSELFDLIALHAGSTNACQNEEHLKEGCHFMLLRYAGFEGSGVLRSFLLPPDMTSGKGVLDADELTDILCGIIQNDYRNSPELFFEMDEF